MWCKSPERAGRTLTKLYNVSPAWLVAAHRALDLAVAQAYGWSDYTAEMPDEEILKRLLALNLQRTAPAASAAQSPPRPTPPGAFTPGL